MSERERWVVYPLLFLTLGVALRDKLLHPVQQRIITREIVLVDEQHRQIAYLGPAPAENNSGSFGSLVLYDPRRPDVVPATINPGGIAVPGDIDLLSEKGNRSLVRIASSPSGGMVQVFHRTKDWNLALGQWEQFTGLFVQAVGNQFQQGLIDASQVLRPFTEHPSPHTPRQGMPPEPNEPIE